MTVIVVLLLGSAWRSVRRRRPGGRSGPAAGAPGGCCGVVSWSRASTRMRSSRRTSISSTSSARRQAASEAGGGVALRQPQQLVSLPELRPGQRALEEPLGVGTHRLAQFGGAPPELVGRTPRVGAEFCRVVVGVGGAAAALLARMDLEQCAAVVDAHQLRSRAGARPAAPAGRARTAPSRSAYWQATWWSAWTVAVRQSGASYGSPSHGARTGRSSSSKTSSGRLWVVPWMRCPATLEAPAPGRRSASRRGRGSRRP